GALGVAELPIAGLGGVDPGVIENASVGKPDVEWLADLDSSEPPDADGEVLFGIRPILRPPSAGSAAAGAEEASASIVIGVFDADEVELGSLGELGFERTLTTGPSAESAAPLGPCGGEDGENRQGDRDESQQAPLHV